MSNIPSVPSQNPGQSPLYLPRVQNPYVGLWWQTQTVTNVPESVMGWLVAQGFEITGITQIPGGNPPTNLFALTREGMTPQQVLLSLCNAYTTSANEARTANEIRYNQVVENWTTMVNTSHAHFESQTNVQNVQAALYLGDLNTYMSDIENLIQENRTQVVLDAQAARQILDDFNTRLGNLESNASSHASTINGLLSGQTNFLATFLAEFTAKLDELDQDYLNHLSKIDSNITNLNGVLEAHIPQYNAGLAQLQVNYDAHAVDLDALLATALANVNEFTNEIKALLNSLNSDYANIETELNGLLQQALALVDAHAIDYNAILALLTTDYASHSALANGFLIGLGTTELARITEQAQSAYSQQVQDLISNGLYTSVVALDIRERNWRDRDEQIQLQNDRLMREKLENQHRLYEQQVGVRSRTLDGKDRIHSVRQEILRYHATLITQTYSLLQDTRNRTLQGRQAILGAQDANTRLAIDVESGLYAKLQEVRVRLIEGLDRVYQLRDALAKWKNGEETQLYEQLQRLQSQHLSGIDRQHALRQEVSRIGMSQRDSLLQQVQTALQGLLSGKERYSSLIMQQASQLADHKHRAIIERMNTSVQRLQGLAQTHDQNRQLMAYQLDERNKLLVGLYSFVQERNDIGPEWENMAKMVASLGDTGGGWMTP